MSVSKTKKKRFYFSFRESAKQNTASLKEKKKKSVNNSCELIECLSLLAFNILSKFRRIPFITYFKHERKSPYT